LNAAPIELKPQSMEAGMAATLRQHRATPRVQLQLAATAMEIGSRLRSATRPFLDLTPHGLATVLALAITSSVTAVPGAVVVALILSFYAILSAVWLRARWLVFLSLAIMWRLLFALMLLVAATTLLARGDDIAALSIAITLPFMYEGPRACLFGLHIGLLALLTLASGEPAIAGSLSFHPPGPIPVYCASLGAILVHRLLFGSSPFRARPSDLDISLVNPLAESHAPTEDQLAALVSVAANQMPYALCWLERDGQWRGLAVDRSGDRRAMEDGSLVDRLSAADISGDIIVDCERGDAVRLTPRGVVSHSFDSRLSRTFAQLLDARTLLFLAFDSSDLRARFALASDRRLSLGALNHFRGISAGLLDQMETLVCVAEWRRRILREARAIAARDMHDSVLQTLGGLRMRIAALGHAAVLADVSELDTIIAAEQRSLRTILQQNEGSPGDAVDLTEHFDRRLRSLARQWDVVCSFRRPAVPVLVSAETAFECEFLLREALANAVKHAGARMLTAGLALDQGLLIITLGSDGGFAKPVLDGAIALASRSLAQRVVRLNGTAYTEPTHRGVLLSIRIPMETK